MAPPSKLAFIAQQAIAPGGNNRLFSRNADGRYQPLQNTPVPLHWNQLPFNDTRNEHQLAILAHTRGVPGINCNRRTRGNYCVFADTIVFPYVNQRNQRVMVKCTNCHFQADGADCGAIAAQGGNVLVPAPVAAQAPVAQAPPQAAVQAPVAAAAPQQSVASGNRGQAFRGNMGNRGGSPSAGRGGGSSAGNSPRGMGSGGSGRGNGRGGSPLAMNLDFGSPRSNPASPTESFQTAQAQSRSPSLQAYRNVSPVGRPGQVSERNVNRIRPAYRPEAYEPSYEEHSSYASLPEEDGGSGDPYEEGLRDFTSRENALLYASRVGIDKALQDLQADKARYFARWQGRRREDGDDDPFSGPGGSNQLFRAASIR